MNVIEFKLDSKCYDSDNYIIHNADECIFVTKGKVDIYIENDIHHLEEGDSIYILANTRHKIFNPTDE